MHTLKETWYDRIDRDRLPVSLSRLLLCVARSGPPDGCGIFPRYGRYPVRKVFRENKGRDKENRVLNDFISLRGDLVENRTPTQLHVQSEYGSFRRAAIPFLSPSLPIPFLPLSPLPD